MYSQVNSRTISDSILPLYMQDSGQYSINTEASSSLQLQVSMKEVCKSYTDSEMEKWKGRRHRVKTLPKVTLTYELLLMAGHGLK